MSDIGNGEGKTPAPERVIQNPENREIVTFLGNLVVEAKQHAIGLHTLYERIRDLPGPVPKLWVYDLVDEQERHIRRVTGHLEGMRSAFG